MKALQLLDEKNRVQKCCDTKVGDQITFFSADERKMVSAEVVGLPSTSRVTTMIVYRPYGRNSVGTLRLDKVAVYKVKND